MEYNKIPYIEKPVSKILFGTATKSFMKGQTDYALLDQMFDMGINTLDLARVYGDAETAIGRWIKERNNRDKVVLLSKCGHPNVFGKKRVNEKEIRKDFAKSSKALGTDYLDIYLLHRDDPEVEVGEIVEIMNAMHEEGKIGAFGGSNWTHERIAQANAYADIHGLIPFTVSSPNFGLAEQVKDPWGGGCVTISGPSNENSRNWYRENQMPVIAYSSLGRGLFSGRVKSNDIAHASKIMDAAAITGYGCADNFERLRRCEELAVRKNVLVPQIAMAWIFKQHLNAFAVVSTSNADRMQQNMEALSISLTEDEARYLNLQ